MTKAYKDIVESTNTDYMIYHHFPNTIQLLRFIQNPESLLTKNAPISLGKKYNQALGEGLLKAQVPKEYKKDLLELYTVIQYFFPNCGLSLSHGVYHETKIYQAKKNSEKFTTEQTFIHRFFIKIESVDLQFSVVNGSGHCFLCVDKLAPGSATKAIGHRKHKIQLQVFRKSSTFQNLENEETNNRHSNERVMMAYLFLRRVYDQSPINPKYNDCSENKSNSNYMRERSFKNDCLVRGNVRNHFHYDDDYVSATDCNESMASIYIGMSRSSKYSERFIVHKPTKSTPKNRGKSSGKFSGENIAGINYETTSKLINNIVEVYMNRLGNYPSR